MPVYVLQQNLDPEHAQFAGKHIEEMRQNLNRMAHILREQWEVDVRVEETQPQTPDSDTEPRQP